ncbi:MAG TPA: PRC-barrel domain-containing protein [Gammaproteobacteria bacterium]|nr:PRC-barrel domain-containing protein [Gammaproteobacteria bacterium]
MARLPLMPSDSLTGEKVKNMRGESLGRIEHFMLDLNSSRVAYAVLSFSKFVAMHGKLFAVPLTALKLDADDHSFILDVDTEQLKHAPGFDENDWPDMTDPEWERRVQEYYAISSNRHGGGSRMKH